MSDTWAAGEMVTNRGLSNLVNGNPQEVPFMKYAKSCLLTLAVVVFSLMAFAQHGHGSGGSMGPGVGHGSADHGCVNSNGSGSTHGMTVNQVLSKNTALASKIQTLTGMPSQKACSGFKNLGQCVAAAHVSKNLGISFACMQADMTGQSPAKGSACPAGTGSKSLSLGKTIQTLSPKADSKLESKKATKQADRDVKDSQNHS